MLLKKKTLVISERFFPEEFLVNDLVAEWERRGHQVEVLSQVPSYPLDRIFQGFENKLLSTRNWNSIPVHRVATILGYSSRVSRKVFNYVNFAILTTGWALRYGGRYDSIFVCHTGPLTMASAVLPLKWVWRKHIVIWTQDVWPDTVYAYGIQPNRLLRILLESYVKAIYSSCDIVAGSSPGFSGKLSRFSRGQVHYVPQWFSIASPPPLPLPKPSPIVFTFAGNFGSVQNLDRLVSVFGELRLPNCVLQLVGDGVMRISLEELVRAEGYTNVRILARQPMDKMPGLFAASHVLVLSLRKEPIFGLTVPAKFQAYLTAGRALLAVADGEVANLVRQHELGGTADPDDEASIAQAFQDLALMVTSGQASESGKRAYSLSRTEFGRDGLIERLSRFVFR